MASVELPSADSSFPVVSQPSPDGEAAEGGGGEKVETLMELDEPASSAEKVNESGGDSGQAALVGEQVQEGDDRDLDVDGGGLGNDEGKRVKVRISSRRNT